MTGVMTLGEIYERVISGATVSVRPRWRWRRVIRATMTRPGTQPDLAVVTVVWGPRDADRVIGEIRDELRARVRS